MAITKTSFINYTRCNRYPALDRIQKDKIESNMTYDEYLKELESEHQKEILSGMYEKCYDMVSESDVEIDLIEQSNESLEAMMKYYKGVEEEAAKVVKKVFKGTTKHAMSTKEQESFDFNHNGVRYICYVDIINEFENNLNIIEVKATTSSGFLKIGPKLKGERISIFAEKDGIFYLKEELGINIESEMSENKYFDNRNKLFRRYKEGKYIHDLAVQRMIIEGEFKETNQLDKIKKTKYYLAVLNNEYVFDGTYENNEPVYNQDASGNEIVRIFDFTKITEEYQEYIIEERDRLEKNIFNPDDRNVSLGSHCQRKGNNQCKYFDPVCAKHIPSKNSVLNYNGNIAFEDEFGNKYKNKLELVNDGYINLLDVPESWVGNVNHLLQRDVVRTHKVHINKDKINYMLSLLKYPIYHLDFETFPCPLPRFSNEKCYEQSPFEFSLHIEHAPSVCDKDKDNYVYLNKTLNDEREEIAKKLVELIDPDKGTMLAQNVGFEKSVLKRLSALYPEYKDKLLKIAENSFDLLYIVKGKDDLTKDMGFDDRWNYYHEDLNGSFSIKKTLPVFSNLSYDGLIVKNGTEAYITYLKYPLYSKEEFGIRYQALVTYCKQDTWAMVEILDALRKLAK